MRQLTALTDEPANRAVFRAAYQTGYAGYLKEHPSERETVFLLETLGLSERNPAGLLRRIEALKSIITDAPNGENAVVLSTIHSSKGLEYDTVFLCDILDGILPAVSMPRQRTQNGDITAYEEERRLFYVGMTRAKNHLCLFSFEKKDLRSSFVEEIFSKPVSVLPPTDKKIHTGRQEEKLLTERYRPGAAIVHHIFGEGTVTAVNQDILTICFTENEVKKCSLSVMLERGLIRLKEDD